MRAYTLAHLSDATLLHDLTALVVQERATTASLLAHLAEVDARRLYVSAGYASMFEYCVEQLRLSEDAAYKRIQAARAARSYPDLFVALADGRLHLAAVCLLAPHLTPDNVAHWVAAATHRRKSEIERLLALRFPRPELPAVVRAMPPRRSDELAPGQVGAHASGQFSLLGAGPAGGPASEPPPDTFSQLGPGHVGGPMTGQMPEGGVHLRFGQDGAPMPDKAPDLAPQLAPGQVATSPNQGETQRFLLRLTIDRKTHDKLRHAQALLSHAVPSGDVAKVLGRALDALIAQLEKRKFAARTGAATPSSPRATSTRPRHIPAHVRRAVWERDQGRCTFVSETGHRCSARWLLEFDHIDPVARGGRATLDRVRLRCRAHNQFDAERVFGAGFMSEKRDLARRTAAASARTPHDTHEATGPSPTTSSP